MNDDRIYYRFLGKLKLGKFKILNFEDKFI